VPLSRLAFFPWHLGHEQAAQVSRSFRVRVDVTVRVTVRVRARAGRPGIKSLAAEASFREGHR